MQMRHVLQHGGRNTNKAKLTITSDNGSIDANVGCESVFQKEVEDNIGISEFSCKSTWPSTL